MKVFNTLSGQKEEFLPHTDEVRMYVCGVTPYADCHIGHAMSYIVFDAIRRYLQFRGYKVKYVQNITDIDDKIIDRANKLGIAARELAERFTNGYFNDMALHSICQPGLPGPHGLSHAGSPGLDAFQRTKSIGCSFSSPASIRIPAIIDSRLRWASFP